MLFPLPHMGGTWRLVLSAFLGVTGLSILALAVGAFVRAKTTVNPLDPGRAEELVTSGLFRFSRNPMYLGMLMVLTAGVLWLGAWSAMLAPIVFIWVMTEIQIKIEERSLQQKFGDQFSAYRVRTRRWL